MPPDLSFALTLIAKMAVTAGFVLAATVTAERAGPLVGGLVATLPIGAGPVYVFLAMDHDAHFIAQSALVSLALNAVNAVFALTYALLAQKRPLSVSLAGALAAWLVLAFVVHEIAWSFATAAAVNVVVIAAALWIARPLRHVRTPAFRARWYELALRAMLVAILVAIVVSFSFQLGAAGSGMLAVFPVVLFSLMIILHRRVGGKPAAAVLANTPLGLAGFACACSLLHFTAEPLGSPAGLALALTMSVGWSLLMLLAHRSGVQV